MAAAGVAARRVCEELIETGHVKVNGKTVTRLPVFVDPEVDHIVVDGRPITRQHTRQVYIMFNKPERVLTTAADEPGLGRKTVTDLVLHPSAPRLFPVGRLDYQTKGLVLLTNDGEMANLLTHPRYEVPKTYEAVVKGVLDVMAVQRMQHALVRQLAKSDRREGRLRPAGTHDRVEIAISGYDGDRTTLRITMRDGRGGSMAAMLTAAGATLKSLERTAIGPLELSSLARGHWRELERREIGALRKAARLSRSGSRQRATAGAGHPEPSA